MKGDDWSDRGELKLNADLTGVIIGCAFRVYNKLGAGFLEKLYENALFIELQKQGLKVAQQYPISVYYEDVLIGKYLLTK